MVELSIAIPVYNCGDYILKTLQTILEQVKGYEKAVEVVISDNASTDNTQKVIKRFIDENKEKIRIHYFRNQENLGLDENVWNALIHSRGRYVHIHSADDFYAENGLPKLMNVIQQKTDYDVICLSNRYLNVFTNEFIMIKDETDGTITCNNIIDFIPHEQLKMLCISNIVTRRELVAGMKNLERMLKMEWPHLFIVKEILHKNSKIFIFNYKDPIMTVRFGNQSWPQENAASYYYRALVLYEMMIKKNFDKKLWTEFKDNYIKKLINPRTGKSKYFTENLYLCCRFFRFYFPHIKKWFKFSKNLLFSKKQDFFSGLKGYKK